MKIQSPPGMRDFYPDDMRLQNWLFDAWRRVSQRHGFAEYEGPIFEFLELYELKSGQGIVSELFNFEDRGGRRFAIRPEMTPTLARMVAARANALPRPIKWFSIPRMCRAERPQRGRLREFFQWNIDVLGSDSMLADAEVIATAVELLREVGLSRDEVVLKYSSRQLAAAFLESFGIPAERAPGGFELIDRREKLGEQEFARRWNEAFGAQVDAATIETALKNADPAQVFERVRSETGDAARAQFEELRRLLDGMGAADYCEFDLSVVRGLAYYTGTVFEVYARNLDLRAVAGGGRYDNLTEVVGGPRVPGVGFGMGDAPMFELLKELGRLPTLGDTIDAYVIDAAEEYFPKVLEVAGKLRRQQLRVDFSYKRTGMGKQFKQAVDRGARFAVVVGAELSERNEITIKNLKTSMQQSVPADAFLENPASAMEAMK